MPTWRDQYQQAHREHQAREYQSATKDFGHISTNFPDHRTANGKNRIIVNFLNWKGYMADRTNSMGVPMQQKIPVFDLWSNSIQYKDGPLRWRRQNSKRGRCDVTAVIDGIYHGFETKTPNDRLSAEQRTFHADVRRAGGVILVVGPIEDFFTWYANRKVSLP